ncbi:septal ring lytic transglycosylase RlpA family protein [Calothrix sp. PCC 7507]|uniref:septal ring lytic transglycosylase RlpA family protein n=1 Tax=Calothrix sp. PCC 7507 TaxID=99598 RepID=UPI00029F0E40|nr:septal ring lytic transglycosylase RlpA family protein [Calothrix sp. PCC 7507]AFY34024.1 rare lipoprotein A [Calothrix sp. PCC 7507]
MLFFGIFWITSWIGSFLSLSENLSPSLTSKIAPTEVTSNLGKLVSKHSPLDMLSKQPVNVWRTTLLPTNFLKMDWGTKESPTNLDNPLKPKKKAVKSSQNRLCQSNIENLDERSILKKPPRLASAALIKASFPHRDFLPNKILRSLQDFFRFHNSLEQSFNAAILPVAVVHRNQETYEIWVNNRLVANLPSEIQAKSIQQRLLQLLASPNLDANQLRPALVDDIPALMAGNRFLFGIEKQISRQFNRSGDILAIEWINNLRSALKAPTLTLLEGQQQMYGLTPTDAKLSGLASWYGGYFHGRMTANGEIYNQDELTVAHKSLPFNTYLQVTNLKTGKAVIVRVNDRGPYIPPRSLDLSREAARCINSEVAGVVPYQAVILDSKAPKMTLKPTNLATGKLKPTRKLALISDF